MPLASPVQAQQNDVPLQRDILIGLERDASLIDARVFSGLKPLIEPRADLTNVMGYKVDSTKYYWTYTEKLYKESLFIVKEGDFRVAIDPLFNFEMGIDPGDATAYSDTNRFYMNTRGFRVKGDVGPKVSFQTMFHENQGVVPQHILRNARRLGVMSGQGRVKVRNVRNLDFGWSQANVSYSPTQWLNVQLGNGKHFVGHGYRSVLLSDNSISAPYLKFSALTPDRRLQYTTWNTRLMHGVTQSDRLPTGDASESLFRWMRARFNHLALRLGRVELGLFEATLFRNIDEDGVRPFDPLELNPVIGINSLVNGFDGDHKSLVGFDLRVKVVDKVFVYGQLATDRLEDPRFAWQAGFRLFDVVRRDIHLQVEYNVSDPSMYMHDPEFSAYLHAGLPLAHPRGTNFQELVAILDVGFNRVLFQGRVVHAQYNEDPSPEWNYGNDLLKPDVPTDGGDGPLLRRLTFLDISAGYLFNPVTNMRFMVGLMRRDLPGVDDGLQSSYIYIALRTSLFNRYYDI